MIQLDKGYKDGMTEDKNSDGLKTSIKDRIKSNTETIRERSVKHQLKASEPSRQHPLRAFLYGFTWPVRKLMSGLARLNRYKFFRIIGYIVFPVFLRHSIRELKLVSWPDLRTSWRLTYAVIVFSVIFGVIVAIVDFILDKLFKELILK